MACILYARYNGKDERVRQFKTREAAEEFWRHYEELQRLHYGRHLVPIYVETGRRKSKK